MTSEKLFGRVAKLKIGSVGISFSKDDDLRMIFKIEKNNKTTEPNKGQFEIYNLSQHSRQQLNTSIDPNFVGPPVSIAQKYPLSFEAGYSETHGIVFKGHAHSIIHTVQGPDVITKIIGLDGMLTNEVRVKFTIKEPASPGDVLTKLFQALKKSVGSLDISQAVKKAKEGDLAGAANDFLSGVTFSGLGKKEIEKILGPLGYEASEQNGQLQLLKINEALTNAAIVLSGNTGLIGTIEPVKDDKRPNDLIIKASSLLRHELGVNSGVRINSEVMAGLFKIRKLEHMGDTHGSAWRTDFEAVQVRA